MFTTTIPYYTVVPFASLAALFWMIVGHALADYPLQGDWLSKIKNHKLELVPGEKIWPMALWLHAFVHAGAVQLATQSWLLAVAELLAHVSIDYAKCNGNLNYNEDQGLHIFCKFLWFCVLTIASLRGVWPI